MGTAVASAVDPWFVNTALTMSEARHALSALVGRDPSSNVLAETGVLQGGATPFLPTSNGTSGAPRVSVAAGHCVLTTSGGGTYICTWPAAANVTHTAPAGNPRIDVLCARVRDTDVDVSGVKLFELLMVDGTAAASPAVPATPAGYIALYNILVAASPSGALTITDVRQFTRAAGGVRPVASATALARAGSYNGDLRVQTNGQVDVWLTSAWVTVATPAVWTSFTPTLFFSGTVNQGNGAPGTAYLGAGGTAIGRYLITGKNMNLRYIFRCGGQIADHNFGSGTLYSQLPAGITSAPQEETQILAKINNYTNGIYLGKCFIPPSSNVMRPYFPLDSADNRLHDYIAARQSGVKGGGTPYAPGEFTLPEILVIQGTIEIT